MPKNISLKVYNLIFQFQLFKEKLIKVIISFNSLI